MKKIVFPVFFLIAGYWAQAQVADSTRREVKLNGVINFRDLGGYPTKDGRHVKWGKIYRSAELSHISPGGLDTMSRLSIGYVADFRGPYEVKAAPDRIPSTATRVSLSAGSENVGDSNYMKQFLRSVKGDSAL